MVASTCCLLSLSLLLLLGGVTCLGVGIYLVSVPAASSATASPTQSTGSASQSTARTTPPLQTHGHGVTVDQGASHDVRTTLRGAGNGPATKTTIRDYHMDSMMPYHKHEKEENSSGEDRMMAAEGSAGAQPSSAQPCRSLAGGVALLILAACLLAASIALFVVVTRRRALSPPVAKPPAKGELGELGKPGVAVIDAGPAAQEKSGLPPEYGADNSWDTPPDYVTIPFGVPPPTYSEVCDFKSP